MAEIKNPYETLDLDRTKVARLSPKEFESVRKKSFHMLSHKFHPDHNPGDRTAEAKFREIHEANDLLKDAARKASWDSAHPRFGAMFADQVAMGTTINTMIYDQLRASEVIWTDIARTCGVPPYMAELLHNARTIMSAFSHLR